MNLGIIGTAGRGEDGNKLPVLWKSMRAVSQIVIEILKPDRLISGSAAWSDHLAVQLYLEDLVPNITLHLPADWTGHGFRETSSKYDTGRTSNWYHSKFSKDMEIDSLQEIQLAIEKGADIRTGAGGFKERNTDIANDSIYLLAFTFGDGAKLKDGGTADTMTKFIKRREVLENKGTLHSLRPFHYCLNEKKLYSL